MTTCKAVHLYIKLHDFCIFLFLYSPALPKSSFLASTNRLKYLNLEHNEISSIPHLRLLGARVRQEDTSRQTNVETVNEAGDSSLADVLEEKDKEIQAEKEGVSDAKKDVKSDGENENATEFILDEVDEILNQKLVGDEQNEDRNRPEIKPRSSTLTEDPSLLGKCNLHSDSQEELPRVTALLNCLAPFCFVTLPTPIQIATIKTLVTEILIWRAGCITALDWLTFENLFLFSFA